MNDAINFGKKDILIAAVIFLAALALRLPYNNYPTQVVGDEGLSTTFITNTVLEKNFFEGHPPLGWYFFSFFVDKNEASNWDKIDSKPGTPWPPFPYERLRTINAVLGSLLAVGIFFTARSLGLAGFYALLPSVFAVFDNALVEYSRLILPDTLMLLSGVSGFFLSALAVKKEKFRTRIILALFAGILFGLAASVKWTGLGFLLAAFFLLVMRKGVKEFLCICVAAFVVYFAVFAAYFGVFPKGPAVPSAGFYENSAVSIIEFPGPSFGEMTKDFVAYNREIFVYHNDLEALKNRAHGGPILWPLSIAPSMIHYWGSGDEEHDVVFVGNRVNDVLVVIAVLYFVYFFAAEIIKRKKTPETGTNAPFVLTAAYFGNYIPFFFITRPMFLYHYFPALIFGFLLVPFALLEFKKFIRPNLFNLVKWTVVFGSIAMFLSIAKITYGF